MLAGEQLRQKMTPDWLKRLKKASTGPDINKPVPVGEIKDLRAPLPEDPARTKRQQRVWDWYNRTARGRQWIQKERQM